MSEQYKTLRYTRRKNDLEAGTSGLEAGTSGFDEDDNVGPFDIFRTMSPFVHRLRQWRQAAFVLNASRRFRYIMDLKKEEERMQIIAKRIRQHSGVIRAAYQYQATGRARAAPTSPGDHGSGPEQLASMIRDHDFSALQSYGGVNGLANTLKTSLDKGISGDDDDIVERKIVYGSNTYPKKRPRSFWRFSFDACRDTAVIILMVAAAAYLALGIKSKGIKEGWYDGGSVVLAVIIVVAVTDSKDAELRRYEEKIEGAATLCIRDCCGKAKGDNPIIFLETTISDYKQSLQFQLLNEEEQNIHMEVTRGGRRVYISIFDIVVGDVIPLKIGDQVPADGILISGCSLTVDESSMTRESKIVHKNHKAPFLMSGCKIAEGNGTMLVTSVGIYTDWGLLMACMSEDYNEKTPLQVRLNRVATFFGMVGKVVAVSVAVVLLARYFTGHNKDTEETPKYIPGKTKAGDVIFTVAVTVVVVAVPEGLPLALTLAVAYSMRKMMADKALVRRLSACETMGTATTICSGKTGTLTLNRMTVVDSIIGMEKIDPFENRSLPPKVVSLLIESIAHNTSGSVFMSEGGAMEAYGSPTEKAILRWGINLGMVFDAARSGSSIIQAFPFSSETKRGGVAVQLPNSDVHVHWKGAAEIVLAHCRSYLNVKGLLKPMTAHKRTLLENAIEDMAAGSLRCVAFAYRTCEKFRVPDNEEELAHWILPEDNLVMLGIAGLKDPCHPSVKSSVHLCTGAGIKVRMVTGDHLHTATAIALECGILQSNDDAFYPNVIEGKIFREFSEADRLILAEKISVMGRSSPIDKILLVQALRKNGHVVAVTGNDTTDAPALHEADIGLAMGIQGTEAAKESSDIIILDDHFASVVTAVRWGRSVYANIKKFIQFQLTVNISGLVINIVAAISSGDVPLNAVQLLWANLIMDTLGALALATEPPTDYLMKGSPVGRREPLITNIMWRNLLIQALYQITVLLVLNFQGKKILNLEHENEGHAVKVKNTLIFNAFILCQLFNEFNARKPDEINVFKGVTRNRLFMRIVGLTLIVQVIIITFLGKFTSTVRLSWRLWLVSIAIGFISWPLAAIGKLIPVPKKPLSENFTRKSTSRSTRG